MLNRALISAGIGISLLLAGSNGFTHVPYLEEDDFSAEAPFVVKNIPQSKAMYGWLDGPADVDHFVMQIDEPTRIYMHTNIPYCAEYEDFTVTYALTGPGLPEPDAELPVQLPEGHGAVIVRDDFATVAERPVMYERFSSRVYYEGPAYSIDVETPGEYSMIVWHDSQDVGDYVAVIGKAEQFGPVDIWRALTKSFQIRRGKELHIDCTADPEELEAAAQMSAL